ncbi:hypothetical protein HID58_013569 [Brassica napus]|uniref:Uncharacterized protein n=1 Tax=Brassica napus TaxID=3708 RepID=A0ABQ8E4B0_BRANA|nr:hypothetical protein HID58_013569 [Brassica napus]
MAVDERDELPEATQREAELQRQIDDPQGQVTGLHRTREETNPKLYSEFQILKEKLNEHSKQLEQSAEKLSQLESEYLTLPDVNKALNTASNKKRRFRTQYRLMLAMILEYYGYRKSGCGKNERCSGNGSNHNSGGYRNGSGSKYDRAGDVVVTMVVIVKEEVAAVDIEEMMLFVSKVMIIVR